MYSTYYHRFQYVRHLDTRENWLRLMQGRIVFLIMQKHQVLQEILIILVNKYMLIISSSWQIFNIYVIKSFIYAKETCTKEL